MLNSTIYTVYTDTLATELPQVDLGATKALDLLENQPASYILTKLAAICVTMATKLPQLRMRKTYLRWAESSGQMATEMESPGSSYSCISSNRSTDPAIFRFPFLSTVASAMYVLAVLLTPVAVVILLLVLLRIVQPQAPTIIVHLYCTRSRLMQEELDDEQDEDYWHTPVQETQHSQ